jgi:alkylhydroperoxidase/carboxymuconolactone decarboxylase family protein YurZ
MMISDEMGAGNIRRDVQAAIQSEIEARLCFIFRDRKIDEGPTPGLTRKEKELILMALNCIQVRASLAGLHARAAMASGAVLGEVIEVAVLTILERGMAQFKMAGLAAIEEAEAAAQSTPDSSVVTAAQTTGESKQRGADIHAYIRETLGVELPDMWAKLEKVAPYALDGYMRIRQGVLNKQGAATKRLKELVVTAMDVSISNSWGAPVHVTQAVRDGATVQDVVETVALAMIEGGLPVYCNGGKQAIRAAEELRRSLEK